MLENGIKVATVIPGSWRGIQMYEITCSHCNSKLTVKETELMGDSYSLPEGEESNYLYIECPVCKEQIMVEVNQILCDGVKLI